MVWSIVSHIHTNDTAICGLGVEYRLIATLRSYFMHIFRVSFHNQGRVYRLHAERVVQSELYGFIEIADLLFDEHTSLVIDPAEEKLKAEFAGTSSILLPIHAIIRIDQVEQRGQNMIFDAEDRSNVTPFPSFIPPGK